MWMGMTSRTAILATLKTFAFVEVIPAVVFYFASAMLTFAVFLPRMISGGSSAGTQLMAWYPLLSTALAAVLTIAKDIGFFVWARGKLYSSFRAQATKTFGQPPAAPPPIPVPLATPPVIRASVI